MFFVCLFFLLLGFLFRFPVDFLTGSVCRLPGALTRSVWIFGDVDKSDAVIGCN
jgi:hypothetical protein